MPHYNYFKKLKQEFEGHPYQRRFIEELEAHLEDYCEENGEEKKTLTTGFLRNYFGLEANIKTTFIKIIDPWRNLFFICEGLLLSLFSIVIGNMYFNALSKIFFEIAKINQLTYISVFFVPFLWIMVMEMAYTLFNQIKPLTNKKITEWNMLIHIPALVTFSLLTFIELPQRFPNVDILWKLMVFLLIISTNLIVAILGKKISFKKNGVFNRLTWDTFVFIPTTLCVGILIFTDLLLTHPVLCLLLMTTGISSSFYIGKRFKKNKSKPIPKWLCKGFPIFFMLIIIARTGMTYLDAGWMQNYPIILILLSPVLLFDLLNAMVWNNSSSSLFISVYVPLILVLAVGLESLWVSIRRKSFLSDRGIVFVYAFSLIFLSSNAFIKSPEFKHSSVSISEYIEKEKVGMLYANMKYANLDKGKLLNAKLDITPSQNILFKYEVGFLEVNNKPYFWVRNNFNETFWINLRHLKNYSQLTKNTLPMERDLVSHHLNLVNDKNEPDRFSKLINYSENNLKVNHAAFSPDNHWAIGSVKDEINQAHEVYLVKVLN